MIEYAFLGGGGNALELYDYMKSEGKKIVGYYDLHENEKLNLYLDYLGDEHNEKLNEKIHYIIASGLIPIRRKIISFIEEKNLIAGSFISQRAYISSIAKFGKGFVVAPFAVCTGDASIGNYVYLNVYSLIGHGTVTGDNIIVGPGAMINGDSEIGNEIMIGANASMLQGSKIGSNVEIAIGTFPKKKIKNNIFVFGNHVGNTTNISKESLTDEKNFNNCRGGSQS